ncbi:MULTISPECIES: thiolase family protein [Corallococcus]|uniref:thiolase family protein n=1 Tax=Corallococcus TaxID=83461 RepID=UPI00117DDAFE|nr:MULTISPECIES: thiolase family protein [Corallococcus]NBD14289.1 acetyl-CoA C-acyltransferase [Corallococcus silvisoli]TSC29375.1 thiolase family protein [Corallococcus sp. Z5C101001]
MSSEAFIVDAVRTPIGRYRGALQSVRPDDLAAHVLRALVTRQGLDASRVDEVFLGCANQAGEDNRNVARMALLLAGLPQGVPGVTVNRLCASGLEAIIQGCRMIRLGEADMVLAGGVESMTRAPWSMPKPEEGFPSGRMEAWDTALGWRYPNPRLAERFPLEQMGETAENVAEKWGISREAQDAFALASHQKAVAARGAGHFARELLPVEVPQRKGPPLRVTEDEGPRADTSLPKLSSLRAAFREGGSVTAGNASTLNDGAAAVVLMSERALKASGRTPLARFVSSASVGVDPRFMGAGPVPATRKALERAGWTTDSLDLVELNEAFAAQALACMRDLELAPERVNVNGGAIALGHPLGASGARIVTTLVHELERRGARRGLAALCVGVGQGLAMTVER